ncbi:indole-3-glycerol phosphate synthase/phosphoribosylanthranilate isomerase [Aeromonas sp. BIGb0405]|uniref:bifunctional indole-3-glycerol-phosphate synthase TrpC/phosphoribosylanthranilate isomerase TrpF n=1 Tax=Aeromonas sp. BIGb0405 TaxID=2940592 RepID=UPI002167DB3A|nr:bifunctional indole-3-glycerol-phosphate synthase TrpC/phosphoribosylanthranilate isomerase TrpF [Aeromonas sp. BIGb0405]MCS3454491.1 indole-3-glycerol phosphate synthase/phosphoribosylanthranilate isomerase [Aeromonas sp. BIGb0405]
MSAGLNTTNRSKDIEMLNHPSLSQTILGNIVAAKQEWVAARKLAQPLASFQGALLPSDRDFEGELRAGGTRFILECKKASPSKGLIRDDFSPEAIADIYGKYATAISVLTDEKFFQGDFAFLPRVRARVKQPVLCKDFMIDPYQVYLARHYQADAILLMLSVLTDEGYRTLFAVARELGLGVLTEVSNEEELERAIALGSPVIGINNRDLRDMSVSLDRTRQLAARIPGDRVVISESGIQDRSQVADLRRHAKGFLVGSSLMSEPDLEAAVRRLVLGQNKVCGLTRAEDATAAHQAGAVFGGLIFVAKSPRYVDIPSARTVMAGAPLSYVGVFRNAQPQTIAKTVEALGLVAVQLHGEEDAAYIEALRPLLPVHCEIWKAVGITSGEPLPALDFPADRLLLDTKVGSQSGGTGQAFDWTVLDGLDKSRLMLAGGLNPDNALSAAQVGCLGLDFNSGVESAPGQKDASKLEAAFAALRQL